VGAAVGSGEYEAGGRAPDGSHAHRPAAARRRRGSASVLVAAGSRTSTYFGRDGEPLAVIVARTRESVRA
jgi:hypothetical protein